MSGWLPESWQTRPAQSARDLIIEQATVHTPDGPVAVRSHRRSEPPTSGSAPRFVWLHGGAFAHGGLDLPESWAPARALAGYGIEVLAVAPLRVSKLTFPLAWAPVQLPGPRHPAPVRSLTELLAELSGRGAFHLGGASSGACLAAASSRLLLDAGVPGPRTLSLAYGTFHARLPALDAELRRRISGRHGLTQYRAFMVELMNRNYVGSAVGLTDPSALPGGALRAGLPPTLILDADRDRVRSSGAALAEELASIETPVRRMIVPDTRHGFLNRPRSAGFTDGVGRIADWLWHHHESTDEGR